MNEIQNIPKIMVTSDYSIFKILDGNRSVKDGRVEKIKSSIKKVGYIPAPIVVNEKMQIIDGQGRFAALKELGYSICYIVVPGLTIDHCVAMNINQSNWTIRDYVESYAKQGNENYKRLLELLDDHSSLGFLTVSAIAVGNAGAPRTETIRDGRLIIDSKRIKTASNICSWIEQNVLPLKGKIKGRFDYLQNAVAFCLEHTDVDKSRLAKVLSENAYDIMPPANVPSSLKEIERVYNRKLSANKIYFSVEYDKYMTANVIAYKERWGTNK